MPSVFCRSGLSPRVRGNHGGLQQPAPHSRSIPACAGEPRRPTPSSLMQSVYPRVCGGTGHPQILRPRACGLSPRVRGNPGEIGIGLAYPGSIPACAGEPSTARTTASPERSIPACAGEPQEMHRSSPRWRVYPRVCGGTPPCWKSLTTCRGLSPRVRGNRRKGRRQYGAARSIPACAGEPSSG